MTSKPTIISPFVPVAEGASGIMGRQWYKYFADFANSSTGLTNDLPSNLGPAAVVGVATTSARADHVHKFPTATQTGALAIAANLSDLSNAVTARGNLGLGTIAVQSAAGVTITGGNITGLSSLGVAGQVGFYGTAPQVQPTVTGSRGGNAALASLLTALDGLGLIVDGSSP